MRISLYSFIFILLFSACAPKAWVPPHKEPVKDPGRIPNPKTMRQKRKAAKAAIKEQRKAEKK